MEFYGDDIFVVLHVRKFFKNLMIRRMYTV